MESKIVLCVKEKEKFGLLKEKEVFHQIAQFVKVENI
jgi:hypothetical protein